MHNVVIIGSGPAGLTAAIYLARSGLEPIVIEGMAAGGTPPGGQLTTTGAVENFPGFPEGVTGPELMRRVRAQAERFGTDLRAGDVTGMRLGSSPFAITVSGLEGEETIEARAVIVATGATARYLGLESERALVGRGVSACATCDGSFFRDQDVVVVGGGDTAMEEALHLALICRSVTVVHRRNELRASHYLKERAAANEKIRYVWGSVVTEVRDVEKGTVTGVRLRDVTTGVERDHACDGLFLAIGHTPNTDILGGQVELLPNGYVKTIDGSTRTSVPGVFAAGDVADPTYRQAVTAAGSGCRAAIDVERYLGSTKG